MENTVPTRYKAEPERQAETRSFPGEPAQITSTVLIECEATSSAFFAGPVDLVVDGQRFTLDENLFCPIAGGPFAGQDCRDVLKLAIEWWGRQLKDKEATTGIE